MKNILTRLFTFTLVCNTLVAMDFDQFAMDFDEDFASASQVPQGFVITFLTGTKPSTIELHASYAGPATSSAALYDSGDGVWKSYTSRSIPVVGNYVAFKGDWRNSSGNYAFMFNNSLASASYTCKFSGAFTAYPSHSGAYREMFNGCSRVTIIENNPIPNLIGSPAANMFNSTCRGMSSVTALPPNFLNTSGITGTPAEYMFNYTCFGMSSVTALPPNFLNTSGITGTPAANMFNSTCRSMSSVTALPENCLNTSGITGSPAVNMFDGTCYGMLSVTNSYDFLLGSGVTFDSTNVSTIAYMCYNMNKWGGRVLWGTNVLALAIPVPTTDLNTFYNCTNMPNYTEINANWK